MQVGTQLAPLLLPSGDEVLAGLLQLAADHRRVHHQGNRPAELAQQVAIAHRQRLARAGRHDQAADELPPVHQVEPLGGVGRLTPRGNREQRSGTPRLDPHGPELQRSADRLGGERQCLFGGGGVLEPVPEPDNAAYGSVRSPCRRRFTARWT